MAVLHEVAAELRREPRRLSREHAFEDAAVRRVRVVVVARYPAAIASLDEQCRLVVVECPEAPATISAPIMVSVAMNHGNER